MRLMPIYQKPDTSPTAKGHKTYPCLLGGLRVERPKAGDRKARTKVLPCVDGSVC